MEKSSSRAASSDAVLNARQLSSVLHAYILLTFNPGDKLNSEPRDAADETLLQPGGPS